MFLILKIENFQCGYDPLKWLVDFGQRNNWGPSDFWKILYLQRLLLISHSGNSSIWGMSNWPLNSDADYSLIHGIKYTTNLTSDKTFFLGGAVFEEGWNTVQDHRS